MLGSGDDNVLQDLGQFHEVFIVSRHLDHQIPVLFGLLLGCSQRCRGHHVNLHVEDLLIDKRANQLTQAFYAAVTFIGGGADSRSLVLIREARFTKACNQHIQG